jgi:molecular chaperone DnaK
VKAIGIDLGTTNSVSATVDPTGRPQAIRNSEGLNTTPSVVLIEEDDTVMVGGLAQRQAISRHMDVIQWVKREMGNTTWRFVSASGREYTAEEVSAQILRKLATDAERMLGEPVTRAVVTVPAYFDDSRRQATKDAGKIAGLEVMRVISEPTAAALAYGLHQRQAGVCLVYDLGGGTFDATVIRIERGDFTVLATTGDRNLGGYDFDNRIMAWANELVVAQGADDQFDDGGAEARLRDQCEAAKHLLSQLDSAPIFIDSGDTHAKLELTRAIFEEVTADLLKRTVEMVEEVVQAAGLSMPALDEVLLVGGSTRMPMVSRAVEQITGRRPNATLHPDEAVALGAAIQAELLVAAESGTTSPVGTPKINDVTAHGLGVVALDEDGRERNFVILPANARIPRRESKVFRTVVHNQTEVKVRVTVGDDEEPGDVEIITKDSDGVELSIPPYPAGSPIEVFIAYDIDGTVHVEVMDLVANRSLGEFPIDRRNNLAPEQVERLARDLRAATIR